MSQLQPLLPVFVKLAERRCLVVGAGPVALQKIENLLECGAKIEVVAPLAVEKIHSLAKTGAVDLKLREYQTSDLDGAFFVIASTNKPEVNHAVYREAQERNIMVNAVDDPPNCDFYFASVVRRGDLQIAISTTGKSPAFAQRLRKVIDALLPEHTAQWLEQLGQRRRKILETHPPGEERNNILGALAHELPLGANISALVYTQPKIEESWWLT